MVLPTESARLRTRELFEKTSLFVVTLGLAEVWFQRRTFNRAAVDGATAAPLAEGQEEEEEQVAAAGGALPERGAAGGGAPPQPLAPRAQVLWRAVPSDKFDPRRHGFRVSSVGENLDNLRR